MEKAELERALALFEKWGQALAEEHSLSSMANIRPGQTTLDQITYDAGVANGVLTLLAHLKQRVDAL